MDKDETPRFRIGFHQVILIAGIGLCGTGLVYALSFGVTVVAAWFLPNNLQRLLHGVEVLLLATIGLELWHLHRAKPRFCVVTPSGRRHRIAGSMVLGSGPNADIRISGPQVSRHHLRLVAVSQGTQSSLRLTDRGSTNGTFQGGQALATGIDHEVRPGTTLRLGWNGPELQITKTESHLLGGLRRWLWVASFLVCGLYLGLLANLEHLPDRAVQVGSVACDFSAFRDPAPVMALACLFLVVMATSWWGSRSSRAATLVMTALWTFVAIGIVVLYGLLPRSGLRYAKAAERAHIEVGAGTWNLWEAAEKAAARPDSGKSSTEKIGAGPQTGASVAGEADLRRRFRQGRSALRWATNLASRDGRSYLQITFFRQSFILLAALGLFLGIALGNRRLGRWVGSQVEKLGSPLSDHWIRKADQGSVIARFLRPLGYRDMLFGLAAALVVAVTLWTPFGTTLGRGKSLYLSLPGIPTVQSVEVVKALLMFFMAGYFARHGDLITRVPRGRYWIPYGLAVVATLGLTGIQADMGGLFMITLFMMLMFLVATGEVLWMGVVPLLILPATLFAWSLGFLSIIGTRFSIWIEPRLHPLGEQLVQARQLMMSSGWLGWGPRHSRAFLLPDVQGDLVIAAVGERYGLIGLCALCACWYFFFAQILDLARRTRRTISILLAGFAALILVQILTQVGGTLGLIPLTGVPLPWISHGLTATLVFTGLLAIGLLAAQDPSPVMPPRLTTRGGALSLNYLQGLGIAAFLVLGGLYVYWMAWLPHTLPIGSRGAEYRWTHIKEEERIRDWIDSGLFEEIPGTKRFRPDPGAYVEWLAAGRKDPGMEHLFMVAEGLAEVDGEPIPRSYLFRNSNRFADRSRPRGRIFSSDLQVLAYDDHQGRRHYPLGAAAFHPVGHWGGFVRATGLEQGAGPYLKGRYVEAGERLNAFVADIHHGPDLVLTLDSQVQKQAFGLLGERRGGAVVLNLESGALMALASAPAIDPGASGLDDWRASSRQADIPLRNRALRSTDAFSPPGSTFKIVMAATALHKRGFNPRRTVKCDGYHPELKTRCSHGTAHGHVDLKTAIHRSCNIYFAVLANELGTEAIRDTAAAMGLENGGIRSLVAGGLSVPFHSGPTHLLNLGRKMSPIELARVGFGQGPVSMTPLDLAVMGAVVASHGRFPAPHLVAAAGWSKGFAESSTLVRSRPADAPKSIGSLDPAVARRLNHMLQGVFETEHRGTARHLPKLWATEKGWELSPRSPSASARRVPVAGKTGSAWKTRRATHDDAWIVAWAPAHNPRVLVAVMLEDAGEGGTVAGPVALELLRSSLQILDAPRTLDSLETLQALEAPVLPAWADLLS